MKIWILASVASFVLLGGDVWGAEKTSEEKKQEEVDTSLKSYKVVGSDLLSILQQSVTAEQKNGLLKAIQEQKAQSASEAATQRIQEFCPGIAKGTTDPTVQKMISLHPGAIDSLDSEEPATGTTPAAGTTKKKMVSDTPMGVQLYSGLRKRYNGVLSPLKATSEPESSQLKNKTKSKKQSTQTGIGGWQGLVIADNDSQAGTTLQSKIDSNDQQFWDRYKVDNHQGKIYLYDTFNISGISIKNLLRKIGFTGPKKEELRWDKVPPIYRELMVCGVWATPHKCETWEGFQKYLRGCSFHHAKVKDCFEKAKESPKIREYLEQYWDYYVKKYKDKDKYVFLQPEDQEQKRLLRGFENYSMERFREEVASTQGEKRKFTPERKDDFLSDERILGNAVYAIVLDELTRRELYHLGAFKDKAGQIKILTPLLYDVAEIIAKMKIITDGRSSALARGVGNITGSGGSLSATASSLIKKMIDEKEEKLKKLEKGNVAEETGTPQTTSSADQTFKTIPAEQVTKNKYT